MADDIVVNVEQPNEESEEIEVEETPEWQPALLELAKQQAELLGVVSSLSSKIDQQSQASATLVPSLLEANQRMTERIESMATTLATLTPNPSPETVIEEMPPMDTQSPEDGETDPLEAPEETRVEVARRKRRAI
jgi:hypothetical protein